MEGLSPADEHLLGQVGWPKQGSLRLAGPSHESARVTRDALQINHVKYDWQYNTDGFHNHLAHSILAAFSLGASPQLIQDTFDLHAPTQRPMCSLRRRANFQNWTRWLGQSEYYSTYLVFFKDEIEKYGAASTLERYLFTYKEGQLLLRSVSGAIHPFIQLGHGVEFGLDALVAEGLAQACVHSPDVAPLFNDGWPHDSPAPPSSHSHNSSPSALASAFSHFKSLKAPVAAAFGSSKESFLATLLQLDPARPRHPRLGLSAFTIIAHMLKDPRLAAGQANRKDDFPRLKFALHNRGDLIRAWCEEWIIDPAGGWKEIVEKVEEVFWVATVLVGASSRPGYRPRMDFFMMHGLTSAIFLPSVLEALSPASRIKLLHSHFRVMIGYWISRGRPYPYIEETLMAAPAHPAAPDAVPSSSSAIRRAINKRTVEEVAKPEEATSPARTDGTPSQDTLVRESVNGDVTGRETDKDGNVNVSLDSPTLETESDPLQALVSQHDEPVEDEGQNDGNRTPTMNKSPLPLPAEQHGKETAVVSSTREAASSTVSWADVITAAVDHSDEHVTKMVRSLAFAGQNFGLAPPGVYRSALSGTDKMDGTIFLRLAGLLLQSMGWEHSGQHAGDWDRSVLGFDEAWHEETREILLKTSALPPSDTTAIATGTYQPDAYKIEGNARGRSNTIFDSRSDYPRKLDKGKGRADVADQPAVQVPAEQYSEQEKLERQYYQDDESDPHAFGEHQQWAEGVV